MLKHGEKGSQNKLVVNRSRYFGKEVLGVRHCSGGKCKKPGIKLFYGKCVGGYYTINGEYKNIHYQVELKSGKVLAFNQVILIGTYLEDAFAGWNRFGYPPYKVEVID